MKPACKECWDPVDKEGADLCDWCQMTPDQREKRHSRSLLLLALMLVVLFLVVLVSLSTGGAA